MNFLSKLNPEAIGAITKIMKSKDPISDVIDFIQLTEKMHHFIQKMQSFKKEGENHITFNITDNAAAVDPDDRVMIRIIAVDNEGKICRTIENLNLKKFISHISIAFAQDNQKALADGNE